VDYGVDAVVPSRSGTADEVNLLYAGSLVDLMQPGVALRSHSLATNTVPIWNFHVPFGPRALRRRYLAAGELPSSLRSRAALCQSNLTPGSEGEER